MAPVANSADGLGDKLPEDSNYWWPFGYNLMKPFQKNLFIKNFQQLIWAFQ
jgi:hypothetical protein